MATLDAIVIGAGHAGLAVSQRLAAAGLDHVVLERGDIGETWRTQRWDSFTLNTPNVLNVLPGSPHVDEPARFSRMPGWIARLEAYAREHTLPIRTHTPVTSVTSDGAKRFVVATANGDKLLARSVVVAAGTQNVPKLPGQARDLDPKVEILTTATYRRPDQLLPGAVLVVGGAQSGCQIAEDLLDAGRDVYLSASHVGRLPRRMRGREAMAWLVEAGWFAQRPEDLPDPAMLRWPQPQISGTGPLGHTVSYQWLAGRGATLLGHLEEAAGMRLRFADDLPAHVRFADEVAGRMRKLVDDHIERAGIAAPATKPDTADETVSDPTRFRAPTDLDLEERGIGSVIFSTGFTGDLSWLHLPVLDATGAPVHAEGRAPVDGVWFVGLNWMRRRWSGIIPGAQHDSGHVVDQLLER